MPGKTLRAACKVVLATVLGLAAAPHAIAQDYGFAPDVKRHALIIANQDYDLDGAIKAAPGDIPKPGYLKDLKNPCRDAQLFRDKLLAAKWQPGEIVMAECNRSGEQMRDLITAFRQRIALSENTVFVFYYSGHGVQFTDGQTKNNFLIGAGAKIDLDTVRNAMLANPGTTSAVAEQAVDLDELLSTIGAQDRNALLAVIDACRNNPLYDQMRDEGGSLAALPLSSNNLEYPGVVIAYATHPGQFSGDGPGQHSIFTQSITGLFKADRTIDSMLNRLSRTVAVGYRAAYPNRVGRQEPHIAGRPSGDWCLHACEVPPADPSTPPPPPPNGGNGGASAFLPPAFPGLLAMQLAAPSATPPVASSAVPMKLPSLRHTWEAANMTRQLVAPGMRFDVFFCVDGPGAAEREKRAVALSRLLVDEGVKAKIGAPGVVASVRTRALSAASNAASSFRYTDDSASIDMGDALETRWAAHLAKISAPIVPVADRGRTPGYIAVAICRAAIAATPAKPLNAFLMVPAKRLMPLGKSLLARVSADVPGVVPSRGIEVRADGPEQTELRYYFIEDRDRVFATAKSLETVLEAPVRIQYLPKYGSPASQGNFEIWLGKDDLRTPVVKATGQPVR